MLTKYMTLMWLALIVKGAIIGFTVMAVTHSFRDSVIIAIVSATITGTFVVISGILTANIAKRQIAAPLEQLSSKAEDIAGLAETTDLIKRILEQQAVIGGRRTTDPPPENA